jgi:hypothetical protein
MAGTMDRVVTSIATQLMLATARTADAVSERVLAQLVEQYPARQQRQQHRHPGDLATWSRDQPPHHTARSRDPAPHHPRRRLARHMVPTPRTQPGRVTDRRCVLGAERARRGDRDDAIPLICAAVDNLVREGQLLAWGIPATGVLVETLLDRGAEIDMVEAEAAIERLAAAPTDEGLVARDIWLLRLRALLARAHGDDARYREYRDRYRDMARTLGFEGHIAWAEAMP